MGERKGPVADSEGSLHHGLVFVQKEAVVTHSRRKDSGSFLSFQYALETEPMAGTIFFLGSRQ